MENEYRKDGRSGGEKVFCLLMRGKGNDRGLQV